MKVAIVILNYNGRAMLEKFLPSVLQFSQREGTEIFVADNASTDDSIQFLAENYPQISTIRLEKNHGFALGYNLALQKINAEYYILLNSDVEVTENWLSVIDFLDENPTIAACQPKIKSWREREKFEYAGACGGFIDKFGYPFCRGRIFGKTETDRGQYDEKCDVFWASGACLCIRAAKFWAVGGFDARFFAHMEEIDLCWRLKNLGERIACFPKSEVFHVGAQTLSKTNPMKTYLNFRNNLTMLYKNLPQKRLCKVMIFRFLADYATAFDFLFLGKWNLTKSIFKARFDFHKEKKFYKNFRKENFSDKNFPEMLDGWIGWEVLVGRKNYQKLKFEK